MNSTFTAAISIIAFFVGQSLVTRQRWTGFLVWAMANYLVAAICALQANAPATCMFLVYFAANMRSTLAWSRRTTGSSQTSAPLKHAAGYAQGGGPAFSPPSRARFSGRPRLRFEPADPQRRPDPWE